MKNLKIALLALFLGAIAIMGTAFKASAQTTQNYQFTASFRIGTTNSAPINNSSNWSLVSSLPSDCGTGITFLCGAIVVTESGQTPPSLQDVIDAIRTRYDSNGKTLAQNETIQIFSGSTLIATITVKLKP